MSATRVAAVAIAMSLLVAGCGGGRAAYIASLQSADPGALDRGPDGFYQANRQLAVADAKSVRVRQGASESSNVSVSEAMVQMISQQRMFDLSMQFIKAADQNARGAETLITGR